MKRSGFVLPLALAVVALCAIVASAALAGQDALARELRQLQNEARFELETASMEARFAHLRLTEPLGPRGLRVGDDPATAAEVAPVVPGARAASGATIVEWPFDGRWYAASPTLVMAVQDEAGLAPLNNPSEIAIERLLRAIGAPEDVDPAALAAALADYVDGDDQSRLLGAEAPAYAEQGLPPPPDQPLRSLSEAYGALGWAALDAEPWRSRLRAAASAGPPGTGLNVNTAPATAIDAVLGVQPRERDVLIAERERRPIRTRDDIAALTGAPTADDIALAGTPGVAAVLAWRSADGALAATSRFVARRDGSARPYAVVRGSARQLSETQETALDGAFLDSVPESPRVFAARGFDPAR